MQQYDVTIQSHLPLLKRAIEATTGPIVEIGTGYFSTIFLHEILRGLNRRLVSVEDSGPFLEEIKGKVEPTDWHEFVSTSTWNETKGYREEWSVALIDQAPGTERAKELKRLSGTTTFLVIHDTEPESRHHYPDLETRMSEFKYRFDNVQTIWATIVSNQVDVKELMEGLTSFGAGPSLEN